MIAKLPVKELAALDTRDGAPTLEPRKVKFIDRIVADSRDVALNHTAGLSLGQRVMMSLFPLAELTDTTKATSRPAWRSCTAGREPWSRASASR